MINYYFRCRGKEEGVQVHIFHCVQNILTYLKTWLGLASLAEPDLAFGIKFDLTLTFGFGLRKWTDIKVGIYKNFML